MCFQDFIMCEIEDIIADGLHVGCFLPFAHVISFIMATKAEDDEVSEFLKEKGNVFSTYRPARPDGRRRGQRALQAV